MTQADVKPSGRATKKRRMWLLRGWWWKWPVVVLLGVLGTYGVWTWRISVEVEQRLAAIRAAGYPTNTAEVIAWRGTISGPNAAEVYEQADRVLVEDAALAPELMGSGDGPAFPAHEESVDSESLAALMHYLEQNDEALDLVEQATRMADHQFAVHEWGPSGLPDMSPIRRLARLLRRQAVVCTESGKKDAAVRAVEQLFVLAQRTIETPSLIPYLTGLSVAAEAAEAAERAVLHLHLSEAQLARIDAVVEQTRLLIRDAGRRAFVSERATALQFYDELSAGDLPDDPELRASLRVPGLMLREKRAWLDVMDGYLACIDDPLYRGHAEAAERFDEVVPAYCMLTHIITPSLGACVKTMLRAQTRLDTLRAAVAVKRYRMRTGEWPETLADLVPDFLNETPVDLGDGGSLRYRVSDDRVTVYSIGADRVDDGGKVEGRGRRRHVDGTDTVIRFGR